jgi:hypothetical protein
MMPLTRDLSSGVSGSIAGITTTAVVTPLDTARTRLQASQTKASGWTVLNTVRKQEGIKALYKGMAAPLTAQAIYKM